MDENDMFLTLKGIPGQEKDPKDAIRIVQWSWGETRGEKVNAFDFHFVTKINKASGKILEYCANGKEIPEATLICREAVAGTQEIYLQIKLTKCKVSSFTTSVDPDNPDVTTVYDNFNLKFEQIDYDYKRGFNINTKLKLPQPAQGRA